MVSWPLSRKDSKQFMVRIQKHLSNISWDVKDKLSHHYTEKQNSIHKVDTLNYLNVARNLIKKRPAIYHVTVTELIFKQ